MRRSMILFVLLIAAGIGGMCYAHYTLSAAQDDVSFAVVEAYGDASAANGLTVSVSAHLGYHLLWDTAFIFGQTQQTHTDFSFHPSQFRRVPELVSAPLSLSIPLDFNSTTSGGDLLDAREGSVMHYSDFTGAYDMLLDVASRTQNGGQHTETLYLRDYYEYYPISAYISPGPNYYFRQADMLSISQAPDEASVKEAFSDFFRFPVPRGKTITVTIRKDSVGNVVGIRTERESEDILYLYAIGLETENGVYFTLKTEGIDDFSNIPGGFGIYLLPAKAVIGEPDTEYLPTLDYRNIQTVYSLDDSTTVAELKSTMSLTLSEDGSCLNLITYEDGGCYLTVIELDTMTEKQKIPLFEDISETFLITANYVDGLLYAALSDNRFMLAEKSAGNTYRPVLIGARDRFLSFEDFHDWYDPNIAWDGHRLALVTRYMRSFAVNAEVFYFTREDTCGFTLEIYDESGLMYKGAFESSLDVLTLDSRNSPTCRLIDPGGLSAQW